MTTTLRHKALALVAVAALSATAGCSVLKDDSGGGKPQQAETSAATEPVFDSQFTRDGTFQSHVEVKGAKGVDFVYTLYPTKATPRTNEWYPAGDKFFSWTFQAYDLDQELRSPFASKRKVYMTKVQVTSATTTSKGGATEQPYALDTLAPRATFDPEPLTTRFGMLITSPKGAFELRNQKIGTVSADTIGLTLEMTATVNIETAAGSGKFVTRTVSQSVPIAIFASDETTVAADIPINAN